jgi:hypothetical protein
MDQYSGKQPEKYMVTGNVNNLAGLIENKNMVCEDVIFL